MEKAKPPCKDFIIAAARQIRKPGNVKPGTASGVSLERLWNITSQIYSREEFQKGLAELLADGLILLTTITAGTGPKPLDQIELLPEHYRTFWLDREGKSTTDRRRARTIHRRPTLYIIKDGLPELVTKSLKRLRVADSILQKLDSDEK